MPFEVYSAHVFNNSFGRVCVRVKRRRMDRNLACHNILRFKGSSLLRGGAFIFLNMIMKKKMALP